MIRALAFPVIYLALAGQAPGSPQLPPRDNAQSKKPGTAVLRGRVVAGDSGQPLRRARVAILSPALADNSRSVVTDADGRYEFKELPESRYTINVSKNGYVTLSFGQSKPGEAGKPLEIADGQVVEKVDFSLPRAGVITGRVVDEFGEPVVDVQVWPQRYQYIQGARRLSGNGRPAATNDLGEFRLYGLSPGDYYLSATATNIRGGPADDRAGYAPTFYPSAPTADMAEKIAVEVGQTVADVVITLAPTRLARISGTAVDSQGQPLVGMVMLSQRVGVGGTILGNAGRVSLDGTFSIEGVAPGTYTLQIRPMSETGEAASADMTVAGADVSDVRLVGTKMVTVSGRVVVDAAAAQSFRPSMYRISLLPEPFGGMVMPIGGFGPGPVVNDDLTFAAKTHPGKVRISFGPTGPAARSGDTFTIRAARLNGADIIDAGLEVKPNEDVADVTIEITNRVTQLSGVVTDARGAAVKDYSVVIFPRDRDRWTPGSRYIRSGRPDQEGRYKINALPPGDYLAIALDTLEPGQANDPEFLERVRDRAAALTIAEGETKTLDLRIVK